MGLELLSGSATRIAITEAFFSMVISMELVGIFKIVIASGLFRAGGIR